GNRSPTDRLRPGERPQPLLRNPRLRRAAGPAARRLRLDRDVRRVAPHARRATPGHRGRSAGPRAHRRHRPPAAPRADGRRHRRTDRAPGARHGHPDGLFPRRRRRPPDGDPPPGGGRPARRRLGALQAIRLVSRGPREHGSGRRGGGRADEADPDLRGLRPDRAAPGRLDRVVGQGGRVDPAGLRLVGRHRRAHHPHDARLRGRRQRQPRARRGVLRSPRRRQGGRRVGSVRRDAAPARHPPRHDPLRHLLLPLAGVRGRAVPRRAAARGGV
ncbi:MAG: Hydrolase, alpha/beta fold family, partial [uncultured Thermomicrobiales bacterium]